MVGVTDTWDITEDGGSDGGGENESHHFEEIRLAHERKAEWLANRGAIVTWWVKPWPASCWLSSMWVGLITGMMAGFLMAVMVL